MTAAVAEDALSRGHEALDLPYLYAGSEVVEFSPTAELRATLEVIERNMAAANA